MAHSLSYKFTDRNYMDATKNDGSDENFIIIISDSQNEN